MGGSAELGPLARASGYRLEAVASTDSTNRLAMARAAEGAHSGLWIVAGEQSAGRGRLGRPWASPAGNLYASLLLINPAPPSDVPQLGFAAGVALCEAVGDALAPAAQARLKWPNDLLIDGAKAAGILLEGTQMSGGSFAVVLGIGINVNSAPEGLAYAATSVSAKGGGSDPGALFAVLSDRMAHWRDIWNGGRGFGAVRARWLELAAGIGNSVSVTRAEGRITGIFRDIDAHGRLVLETASGRRIIDSGDMTPAGHRHESN